MVFGYVFKYRLTVLNAQPMASKLITTVGTTLRSELVDNYGTVFAVKS